MKRQFSLPSVSKRREEFNFDHSHVLTHNFGVHQIVSCIDVKPNDDFIVDLSAFTRLTPLPCPSFGGVKLTHRAFFVPCNYVLRHFEEFISMQKAPFITEGGQSPLSGLQHVFMPYFTPKDIMCVLLQDARCVYSADNDYIVLAPNGATRWDLLLLDSSSSTKKCNYTAKGRRIVSWLAQLGYKIPASNSENYQQMRYDCLALFSFWKYYLDWIVPARFVLTDPRFVYIKSILDNLEPTGQYHLTYTPNGTTATQIDLEKFLMVPTAFLDDDFYTTAFSTPYGVENDSSSLPSGLDSLPVKPASTQSGTSNATFGVSLNQFNEGVAFLGNNKETDAGGTNTRAINQFSLLSLARLQKLVNTKKITSTSVLDWLRSNYGIAPSKEALHISEYLGSFDSQIMIGDIMATATTQIDGSEPTYVGQYAGKGIGGSSAKWRLKSNSFGFLFITNEISTKSSYVNGVSPLRRRFNPLDFYNEKFDNIGVRAIPRSELVYNTFESMTEQEAGSIPLYSNIFGFSPRYSEYKHKEDEVSGDFMFPSVNEGLDSWYLSRKFKVNDDPKIGLEFMSATSDSVGSQYDRIFQNTDNIDHFYSVYMIKVHATSRMEKLYDYFKTINDDSKDNCEIDVNIN